jgi:hypothetical protein
MADGSASTLMPLGASPAIEFMLISGSRLQGCAAAARKYFPAAVI